MNSNDASTTSDRAAARAATAARVMSVRAYRKSRVLDLVAEQGTVQGMLAYDRIRKARTLATVLFLAGAA